MSVSGRPRPLSRSEGEVVSPDRSIRGQAKGASASVFSSSMPGLRASSSPSLTLRAGDNRSLREWPRRSAPPTRAASLNDGLAGDGTSPASLAATTSHEDMLEWLLPELQRLTEAQILAAGHRIVHGGLSSRGRLCSTTASSPRSKSSFHWHAHTSRTILAAVRAVWTVWPDLPQAASFDTAFHRTIPDVGRTIRTAGGSIRQKGVRRYGFHGLSYHWVASRLPDHLEPAKRRARNRRRILATVPACAA